jgi:A/G-specific adenine glycosylase
MTEDIASFKDIVWEYYHLHKRESLPWRTLEPEDTLAYRVLVSEFMLQQTQVSRVVDKFNEWMRLFPTIEQAATASFVDVLTAWSGLGYNRRAKYLHDTCIAIVADRNGIVPSEQNELVSYPGIGRNTAAAIVVYAYNVPLAFVETNIRTVFIHHFFADRTGVTDAAIYELVAQTVDIDNPREWYWALMDYGVSIKKHIGNISRQSRHYSKQSTFVGSRRQLRGTVLRQLLSSPLTLQQLIASNNNDNRLLDVIGAMESERLIKKTGVLYEIVK